MGEYTRGRRLALSRRTFHDDEISKPALSGVIATSHISLLKCGWCD